VKILGLNCFAHDTAAALVVDGALVAFVEEERLNREKHTWAFPDLSIAWCLKQADLSINEVDLVTFDYRPLLDLGRALAFDVGPRLPFSGKRGLKQAYVDARLAAKIVGFRKRWGYRGRIGLVDHHMAHAAAAFLSSPYEEATTISIDRGGDFISTGVFACEGARLRETLKVRNPHSLGELYSAVTWWLGFQPNSDEGKVMALATFGRPTLVDDFREMVRLRPDGGFKFDLSWAGWHLDKQAVSKKFISRYGPRRSATEPIQAHHEDVAFAVQALTEEVALHLVMAAGRKGPWGEQAMCLAGGVCSNSVMNTRLLLEGPFDSVFMQPALGDAGNALGGALYAWHEKTGKPREWEMEHAMWGPEFSDREIESALNSAKARYRKAKDPADAAAKLIAKGKIIGWFQGPAEVGPRALGHRSILADPRPAAMKDTINAEVKHREGFRPFAPSVLLEDGPDWFDDFHPSPFMLLVLPIKRDKRDLVPAVTHVDGSGRLQSVSQADNPDFYRLISAFKKMTGIPMVLNTSFNDNGEPIVCSPADALKTYFATGIDALVIGSYVLEK